MKRYFGVFILIVFYALLYVTPVFASVSVPILVFHSFGPKPAKSETKMTLHYRITPTIFEEQMKYLSDNHYTPISLNTFVNNLKSNTAMPAKPVVLTFDDGWNSQYKYAVPVLEKYNFPATFFVISEYRAGAYMTWDNLKDLVAHGFEIGSHTETHPKLPELNKKDLKKEIEKSKKKLEDKLGIKVTTLAYPYYMHNKSVRGMVKSAGYLGARAGSAKFKNSIEPIYELVAQESVNNPNPFSSKRLPDLP